MVNDLGEPLSPEANEFVIKEFLRFMTVLACDIDSQNKQDLPFYTIGNEKFI